MIWGLSSAVSRFLNVVVYLFPHILYLLIHLQSALKKSEGLDIVFEDDSSDSEDESVPVSKHILLSFRLPLKEIDAVYIGLCHICSYRSSKHDLVPFQIFILAQVHHSLELFFISCGFIVMKCHERWYSTQHGIFQYNFCRQHLDDINGSLVQIRLHFHFLLPVPAIKLIK